MKRFLVVLIFMIWTLPVAAQNHVKLPHKGYAGEASVALAIARNDRGGSPLFDIATTHGYQFSPRFFMGAGVSTLNTQFLTFYMQISTNLRKPSVERPSYPFLAVRGGYTISTWVGDHWGDERGVYFEPKLGWSFYSKAGRLRYNVFTAVHLFHFALVPKIGLAFEF